MTGLTDFGNWKFPDAGLLRSSADRGWRSLAAELRRHSGCDVPAICPDNMEITLAVRSDPSVHVERRGNGSFQRTAARPGTLWLCPIGVQEDSIRITGALPEILHLYLPASLFGQMQERSSRNVAPSEISYLADVEDELIRQTAYRILRELLQESAGGLLLVEQLALGLVAQLVCTYAGDRPVPGQESRASGALDSRRLRRVLDYIEENIQRDLPLANLAEVACLSRFHFARAFRDAAGVSPQRYVSARRLERAQHMLLDRRLSLAEISLACQFSSQASFTRAFQRQMGVAPGEYRRRAAN